MTSHVFHPNTHTHGLQDGCPRCAEHAEDPLVGLDAENVAQLRHRIAESLPARSDYEAIAMARIRYEDAHAS